MRLRLAFVALLLLPPGAAAQWTNVRLPEHVYSAVPFMIDVGLDCPPPGEAPPPTGCNGTLGVWFEATDKSASVPKGFTTIFPFRDSTAGPFTFHKPGEQLINVLSFSREVLGEVILVGQVSFVVRPPTAGAARRR